MSKQVTDIKINGEIADQITILNLQEQLVYVNAEIERLTLKAPLTSYQAQDLGESISIRESINAVLKYYGAELT